MNKKEDIKLDIALTKQAFDKPMGRPRGVAGAILENAITRESNNNLLFVPVNGLTPIEAANRIKNVGGMIHGNRKKCKDPIPVDLSNIFEGTEPITTVNIEKLHSVMSVTKACRAEDIPEEIIFAIPRSDVQDIPFEQIDINEFDQVRYVNYDSMPKELQKVIRMCLTLKTTTTHEEDYVLFVNACRMLLASAAG